VLVLIVDRAGWHTAPRLAVPPNVRLHFLPPRTPELQPVEPFWALVREGVANDTFDRLADLRRVIRRRCRRLGSDRAMVKGAIGFRWAVSLEA
jgi:transposase